MALFDELKSVANTLREADKIPQYEQILSVQEKLLEMQKSIADLSTENAGLKEKLKTQESLVFENNAYWIENEKKKDGPYCSCCWDDDRKTIRMQPCGNPVYFDCPKCENKSVKIYHDKNDDYVASQNNNFDPYEPVG